LKKNQSKNKNNIFSNFQGNKIHEITDYISFKLEKLNIKKKIKNLFEKTEDYKINLPHFNKEEKINKKIKKLKYKCIENILNLNKDLKNK
jgi:hypothetical protein